VPSGGQEIVMQDVTKPQEANKSPDGDFIYMKVCKSAVLIRHMVKHAVHFFSYDVGYLRNATKHAVYFFPIEAGHFVQFYLLQKKKAKQNSSLLNPLHT
jgi:hypothetical protein